MEEREREHERRELNASRRHALALVVSIWLRCTVISWPVELMLATLGGTGCQVEERE